jgi:DNA-binding transcriptional regulator YiaG
MRFVLNKQSLLNAEEIVFLRKMARLSSKNLAHLMGVTPSQVSKWENGEREIGSSSDRLLRLICVVEILEVR